MVKRTLLTKAIQDQKDWIASCGGTLTGYIARYGQPGQYINVTHAGKTYRCPDWYGDGGEAIYRADNAELDRLIGLTQDKRRKYL